MASCGLLSVLVVVMVLVVQPDRADGSSRGSFGGNNEAAVAPIVNGICATSVTIHGYKCQEHQVKTQDGYILNMQRIPEGRVNGSNGGNKKQPVLIQHGVLVDGMTWLLNSPQQNLPMILADNGFDVWIANTRGTRFCRRHVSLHPAQPGTLIGLASFSEGHQADTLKSAAFLSPIAYLSHMKTALGALAARAFVGEITTMFGLAEFNPKGEQGSIFLKALCSYPGIDCYDLISAITGKNCCLNSSTVDLFVRNEPQSTATKNMVHLAQTVRHGVIAKYDYGRPDYNLMHYGVSRPPIYNISNICNDLPIFISYGGQDALSDVQDVQLLLDSLKFHDVNKLMIQYIKDYAHGDFIMGINAKDIVYNQVINFFKHQQ